MEEATNVSIVLRALSCFFSKRCSHFSGLGCTLRFRHIVGQFRQYFIGNILHAHQDSGSKPRIGAFLFASHRPEAVC